MVLVDLKCENGSHIVIIHMQHFKNQVDFQTTTGTWKPAEYIDLISQPIQFLQTLHTQLKNWEDSTTTVFQFIITNSLFGGFGKYMSSEFTELLYTQLGILPWKNIINLSGSEQKNICTMAIIFVLDKVNFW